MNIKSKITPLIRGWYDECLLVFNEPLRLDLDMLYEITHIYMNDVFSWKIDYFYLWFNNYFTKIINSIFTLEKLIFIPFLKGRIHDFDFELSYYDNICKKIDVISKYKEHLKMNLGINLNTFRKLIKELIDDITFYMDYKETIITDILKDNFKFISKSIFLSIVRYNSTEINKLLIPWVINAYPIWHSDKRRAEFINLLPGNIVSHLKIWTKKNKLINKNIYNILILEQKHTNICCCLPSNK